MPRASVFSHPVAPNLQAVVPPTTCVVGRRRLDRCGNGGPPVDRWPTDPAGGTPARPVRSRAPPLGRQPIERDCGCAWRFFFEMEQSQWRDQRSEDGHTVAGPHHTVHRIVSRIACRPSTRRPHRIGMMQWSRLWPRMQNLTQMLVFHRCEGGLGLEGRRDWAGPAQLRCWRPR